MKIITTAVAAIIVVFVVAIMIDLQQHGVLANKAQRRVRSLADASAGLIDTTLEIMEEASKQPLLSKEKVSDSNEGSIVETNSVVIHLECQGVQFADLQPEEEEFSAFSLTNTYNILFEMERVIFDLKMMENGHGPVKSRAVYWGQCKKCLPVLESLPPSFRGYYHSYYNLRQKVPTDFADDLRKWAGMFEQNVSNGPFPVFHNVTDCSLDLVPDGATVGES